MESFAEAFFNHNIYYRLPFLFMAAAAAGTLYCLE